VTPEQEEEVRRALAAAAGAERGERRDAPVPPQVAARLDAVLADLVAERSAAADRPDELADRRARRWPQVLVAAAAVAAIALTGGVVALNAAGGGGESSTYGDSGGSTLDSGGDLQATPESAGSPGDGGALAAVPAPRLRTATLRLDVQRLLAGGPGARLGPEPAPADGSQRPACVSPQPSDGADVVDVLLDGRPATLVVDPATGGAREARVYSCSDSGRVLARTLVGQR
jgi:hypothetical protein